MHTREEQELARRLTWLLVFRAVVATLLLILTIIADAFDVPLPRTSTLLYSVIVGTYLMVVLLGVVLRQGVGLENLSFVYLGLAVTFAMVFVQGTGGVDSGFSFLYLFAILDGAIIAGARMAIGVASFCSLAYGMQLVLQLYEILPAGQSGTPLPATVGMALVTHLAGFYLIGFLGGHLAEMLRRAREMASTAQIDLDAIKGLQTDILESLPVAVLTVGEESKVLMANTAVRRVLGQSQSSLVGYPLPSDLKKFSESSLTYDEKNVHIGGDTRYLAMTRSSVTATAGRGLGRFEALSILVIEDRTAMRALEHDVQTKRRLASIGELASAIAHEIRNPLASISGSLELLQAMPVAEKTKRDRLNNIVLREVDGLNRLVENFLVYARPSEPELLATDMVQVAVELCQILDTDEAWTGHNLSMSGPDKLVAEVDAGQIRRALRNVLRNALEASEPGAPIQMNIHEAVAKGQAMAVIEVVDEGGGISTDIRDTVLEPFVTTKPTGTGLGLAIVDRIAKAHDGWVEFAENSGSGTSVRLWVPRGPALVP